MHWNRQGRAGLLLFHHEHAVLDVLAAHAHDIAAPLRGVEQQRKREARLRADWIVCLELRDLGVGPTMESVALDRARLDVCRWIVAPVAALDCELTERAQGRAPRACGVRRLTIEPRLDPFRWQQCERAVAMSGAEALKDPPAHPLGACALRAEELLRVEILGDDGGHAAGLDAPRTDGSARPAHRRFVGRHEARRPRQAGQAHARESATTDIVIRAAVAFIDPRLHMLRQFHCLVSFVRSASHGFSSAAGSGLPVTTTTVPSDLTSKRATSIPALLACLATLASVGRRGLRGLRAGAAPSFALIIASMSAACVRPVSMTGTTSISKPSGPCDSVLGEGWIMSNAAPTAFTSIKPRLPLDHSRHRGAHLAATAAIGKPRLLSGLSRIFR